MSQVTPIELATLLDTLAGLRFQLGDAAERSIKVAYQTAYAKWDNAGNVGTLTSRKQAELDDIADDFTLARCEITESCTTVASLVVHDAPCCGSCAEALEARIAATTECA